MLILISTGCLLGWDGYDTNRSDKVGCDEESSDPDSADTGSGDSETASDTGDSEDTSVVETGETGTTNACAFATITADGSTVILTNEVVVSMGYGSPDGGSVNHDEIEHLKVLRIEYTSVHPECPALNVTNPKLMGLWSDMADTDWMPEHIEGVDISEAEDENFGEGTIDDKGGLLYVNWDFGFILEGGGSRMLDFYADVSGGSAELDDQFWFDLPENTVEVSDINGTPYVIANPTVGGAVLVL